MGKLQEGEKNTVKREIVSASNNLEIISHESFVKRLEGMSSACANCQRERTRNTHSHNHHHYNHQHSQQQQHQQHHYRREKPGNGNVVNSNAARKGKTGRRKQLSKSNTPIVIHLKDTLRSTQGNKQRQSSLDGDSDVSTRSTDEEQYSSSVVSIYGSSNSNVSHRRKPVYSQKHHSASNRGSPPHRHQFSVYDDVASIPEFVPQYNHHPFHQPWPMYHISPSMGDLFSDQHHHHHHHHYKSPYHQFHSTMQRAKDKSRNNLTALISVIEKSNKKDATKDMEVNLTDNSSADTKPFNMLNNNSTNNVISESVVSGETKPLKRLNMAECDNVDVICNDLSTSGEKLVESTDAESDAASDKASVVSSSDTLSDDVGDHPVLEDVKGHEFTADELEQLAQYTTGVPLIRYDCLPSQCPECINSWYSHQYFQYEGCEMYTAASRPSNLKSQYYPKKQESQPQQQPKQKRVIQSESPKAAVSPRVSMSSESDLSSDFEEGSTSSSLSSQSSSSLSSISSSSSSNKSAKASAKTAAAMKSSQTTSSQSTKSIVPTTTTNSAATFATGTHRHPWNRQGPFPTGKEIQRKHEPVKRATASWKGARQLWDIDVSHASRRRHRTHGGASAEVGPPDSVYMDLTGLDVTFTVIYHSEMPPLPRAHHHHPAIPQYPTWPYPVHSLYQATYSPNITTPTPSAFNWPFRFNNAVFYPQKFDAATPHEFKKYDLNQAPNRPWITIGSPDPDVPAAVFTVMCYNVLCDKLCTKAMYAYCPTWALNWDYRKKGIMSDILRGNGDIITLQEVETEQYYSMFLPELAQQGYDGIFLPKSRVRTMNSDKEKMTVDGCAIFFKKNKFEKVNEYQIEFSQLATKEGASNTDTDMINRVSTKDNIAIVAVLRTKQACYENSPVPAKGLSQMLMVSTAHIHWDPQLPDVKLVQTMMLIEELQKFVKEASMQFRPNAPPPSLDASDLCASMPLILCGDFNSLPDSGVYEFLSKGRLDTSHRDFEGQNYKVFMKDRNDNGIITHNFKLTSAYKDVMPFTNYTFDFKGVIDYVFYSDQHLRLHGVMGLQDEEWFRANKIVGCPHPFVPSDHFPLFAEFSLPAQRPR